MLSKPSVASPHGSHALSGPPSPPQSPVEPGPADGSWPAQVGLILSALAAGERGADRRGRRRDAYRTKAVLRLFTDTAAAHPRVLYTRDVNPRSLGFVTPHRLPLGYGGTVDVLDPAGKPMTIHCTLLRCREIVPDWFEGALYFNREQWVFGGDASMSLANHAASMR